ncbi:hypothetical protein DZF91_05910 [Actinomadura logoneensis]|uniref:Dyp-type peroxidase N-terminal domain-containing protein n=1 Tax=Actinomadura logoneensis TaxID=2293572 RepID=A0A372JRB3_9ACTN|nr:hypothetical protein DZF91_05910 [Actinomadura logoneensis]
MPPQAQPQRSEPQKMLSPLTDAAVFLVVTVDAGNRPAGLHPFTALDGPRYHAPATPGDLLFHIRARRMDLCFELAAQITDRLRSPCPGRPWTPWSAARGTRTGSPPRTPPPGSPTPRTARSSTATPPRASPGSPPRRPPCRRPVHCRPRRRTTRTSSPRPSPRCAWRAWAGRTRSSWARTPTPPRPARPTRAIPSTSTSPSSWTAASSGPRRSTAAS